MFPPSPPRTGKGKMTSLPMHHEDILAHGPPSLSTSTKGDHGSRKEASGVKAVLRTPQENAKWAPNGFLEKGKWALQTPGKCSCGGCENDCFTTSAGAFSKPICLPGLCGPFPSAVKINPYICWRSQAMDALTLTKAARPPPPFAVKTKPS